MDSTIGTLLLILGILVAAGIYLEVVGYFFWHGRWRAALNLIYLPAAITLALGIIWNSTFWACHVTCDFANQWLMGRMFVCGDYHKLYLFDKSNKLRDHQWLRLSEAYDGEADGQPLREMYDDIVDKNTWGGVYYEGPLYPPTAGVLFAPMAMITTDGRPDAYRAHWWAARFYAVLGFASAALISWGSLGRFRFAEAALLIFCFPNFTGAILLGQNPPLTLFLVAAGWALWARGYPVWGGIVWGLLAYKPVFAVAVVWIPILLLNWRMLAGMLGSAAAFCMFTLPFCLPPQHRIPLQYDPATDSYHWTLSTDAPQSIELAMEPWRRWYMVGQNAKRVYDIESNWCYMSRDVYSLPRRDIWHGERFQKFFAHAFYYDWERERFAPDAKFPDDLNTDDVLSGHVEFFPYVNGEVTLGLRRYEMDADKRRKQRIADEKVPDKVEELWREQRKTAQAVANLFENDIDPSELAKAQMQSDPRANETKIDLILRALHTLNKESRLDRGDLKRKLDELGMPEDRLSAFLKDYNEDPTRPDSFRVIYSNTLGYGLIGLVFCFTLFVVLTDFLRRTVAGVRLAYEPIGNRTGFLFLGALLTTFHFIHYDLLVFAVPVAMILGGRHTWAGWTFLAIWCLFFALMSLDLAFRDSRRMPLETAWILLLWLYAGFASLVQRADHSDLAALREQFEEHHARMEGEWVLVDENEAPMYDWHSPAPHHPRRGMS